MQPRHAVCLHNAEKLGWMPLDAPPFGQQDLAIQTRKKSVMTWIGTRVLVIVGVGKSGSRRRPKRYYLWESFEIAEVRKEGDLHAVWGRGWQLVPPQRLEGDDFRAFHRRCAYFAGFRGIDGLDYTPTLVETAERFRDRPIDLGVERLCGELIHYLPRSGDLLLARGWVREQLGMRSEARADYAEARRLSSDLGS